MLDYKLDISEKSYMRIHAADRLAKMFPFCLYEEGYFEAGSSYYTTRDGKDMYLLIYTVSGCGTVKVGDKTRHMSAGSAVMLNCSLLHDYRTVSKEPWCFYWIHFSGTGVEPYAEALTEELSVVSISEKIKMAKYFEEIRETADKINDIKKYAKISHTISGLLLVALNAKYSEDDKTASGKDAISAACNYIEENLSKDISIDLLTQIVHLSKFYFIRLFKQYMGVSPYQYVQLCRINKAKELLVTTDYRINEISDMAGFPNPARFTKVFGETTGMTPSAYRRTSYLWSNPEEKLKQF